MVAHAQPLQKERWEQSVHLAVAQCNNPLSHVAHQLHKARVTLRVVNRKQASNRLPPPGEGVSVGSDRVDRRPSPKEVLAQAT